MKRFLFVLLVFFMYQQSYSFDWSEIVEPNCDTESWGDPIEKRFCYDDFPSYSYQDISTLFSCGYDCCFTVVYYERWTGPLENQYELFVGGVYWDWDRPDCADCLQGNELLILLAIGYLNERDDPDFFNKPGTKVLSYDDWVVPFKIYSPGSCHLTTNPEIKCDEQDYCCYQEARYLFGHNNGSMNKDVWKRYNLNTIQWWDWNKSIEPECNQTTCEYNCEDMQFAINPKTTCDIDCDFGVWTDADDPIVTSYCCNDNPNTWQNYEVYYEYREVECNGFPYYDYHIKSIIKIMPYSLFCDPSYKNEHLLGQTNIDVIKNGNHPRPVSIGESITTYRVINAACWNMNNEVKLECTGSACCWGLYEIEKINDNNDDSDFEVTWLDGNASETIGCEDGCIAVCREPTKIDKGEKDNVILKNDNHAELSCITVPAPTNGNIRFIVSGNVYGIIEIVVSDLNGNILFLDSIDKKLFEDEYIANLAIFNTGKYHYLIKHDNTSYCSGVFTIAK